MTSAGKWVLGLLLLVVGAVFVARTVSSDPGASSATVKNNLPNAQAAASAQAAKDAASVEAAAKKKIASTIAGDVSCKKACVEVNEVAADSITTAKLAPGSVTLSKLAFEVPNLNELENEINARKAAEASVKAAQAEAVAAGAKNDVAITTAASNGITQEAAARTAADEALAKNTAAADADLLSKLNTEVKDRGDSDNVLQGKLNTEISDRAGAINNLRSELGNGNQVGAPIIQINNNEIVGDAVTSNKILADTILAEDLATGAVTTVEILDDTVAAVDLANGAVVGRAAGETLTNVKERTLRGERADNTTAVTEPGDLAVGTLTGERAPEAAAATGNIALGTITGESDNDVAGNATGNLGLETVGRNNLVDDAIDSGKIQDDTVGVADLAGSAVRGRGLLAVIDILTNIQERSIRGERKLDGNESAGDIAIGSITGENDNDVNLAPSGNLGLKTVGRNNLVDSAVDGSKIAINTIEAIDIAADAVEASELANDSVDTAAIQDDAVTTAKIREGNVTTALLDGKDANATDQEEAAQTRAVTAGKLSDDAVINRTIKDGAVTGDKIAELTITAANLIGTDKNNNLDGETRAVTAEALADGAVTNRVLTDNTISIAKLDTDIATQDELEAATDGPASPLNKFKQELGNTGPEGEGGASAANENDDPVSFFKIKDLTSGADGNITTDFVKNGTLKGADVTTVDGDGLTGSNVKNGSITGVDITAVNADGLTAANVKDGSLTGADVTAVDADGLTGANVKNGSLSAVEITTVDADGLTAANVKNGSLTGADVTTVDADGLSGANIKNGTLTGADVTTVDADGLTGSNIKDGSITVADLAGRDDDPLTPGDETIVGAVTSEKIADATIKSQDLAAGSVTANKVQSTVGGGSAASGALLVAAGFVDVPLASTAVVVNDSDGHNLLVSGQAMVTCTCAAPSSEAVVQYQVVRTEGLNAPVAVSPTYETRLADPNPLKSPISVSIVDREVPSGSYTYRLRILRTSGTGVAAPSEAVLNVVDLGR